jgi:two-component system LytT family response regulator
MIKILIVDDEPAASNILKILIEKNVKPEKEIRCCNSPEEGLHIIQEWQPHLLMLDIEMPSMNGFDLLSKLIEHPFHVIFTTAYDKYAIKAIRFSALDYLLKPIDDNELRNAFDRFFNARQLSVENAGEQVDNLIQNLQQKQPNLFKLALSTMQGVHLLDTDQILYCEGVGNYTRFHIKDKPPILVSKTIKEYEELLQDQSFLRVHKSYLVNMQHIRMYEKEGLLQMSNGDAVVVSRRKKDDLKKLLSI